MKIGILIDRLNVGGVEKIAIEEVSALRKSGEEAYLVVLRKKAVVENAFPDLLKNVPIIYLDDRLPRMLRWSFKIPGFLFFSWFHLSYPFFLPFVVKRKEFDYLIAHGTYTSLSAVALKKTHDIHFSAFIWDPASYILKRVYTGRFLAPVLSVLKFLATGFDRFLIKNMDIVLTGGHAHDDFIHKLSPHKKIEVIYPSVHPASKQIKKQDYVLMVTAWKDGKHPEYILTILKELPNLHVKMVGKWVDPEYRKTFESSLKKEGFTDRIGIVGGVSEDELSRYYAEATVLLQTNDDRGFGMPAMEAASKGTTFIIPKNQGVGDLFIDTVHGFYTTEYDTVAIVNLLKKLTSDKSLSLSMGEKALLQVRKNYSWKNHAKKIMEVIGDAKKE